MTRRMTSTIDDCCTPSPQTAPPLAADREQVLSMMKALADGTRFDIFRLIATQDEPICACDIGEQVTVSQPTIAHHMKVLREAGLITVSRQGVWAYYTVNGRGLAAFQAVVGGLVPDLVAVTP